MHIAIGTSLLIIALKSIVGFAEYVNVLNSLNLQLDWGVIAAFIGIGAVGSFAGRKLATKVPQQRLQRIFAVFLLAMGGFILWQNLPLLA